MKRSGISSILITKDKVDVDGSEFRVHDDKLVPLVAGDEKKFICLTCGRILDVFELKHEKPTGYGFTRHTACHLYERGMGCYWNCGPVQEYNGQVVERINCDHPEYQLRLTDNLRKYGIDRNVI